MNIESIIKKFMPVNNFNEYPDAVIVIDQLNNISHWNQKSEEIFGFQKEEMIGRNIELLFDSEVNKIPEAVSNQKILVISSKNRQDENIFLEISCKSLNKQGEIIITLRDVTKNQKVIEKLLIEYETAAKICNNKNKFIFGLSSDLKSPLHSLIGFSQGLLDGVCGELSEKQSKYVAIISKNANNLLEVVDNFLELSGIEAGCIEFDYKVFDIIKTLNNITGRFKEISEKKGIRLEIDLNDIVKKNIYSDENVVSRILVNIIENAVKFTEIGTVRFKALHPDEETLKIQGIEKPEYFNDKSYLMFQVTDTGIGLTEEERNFIFDEYSQTNKNIAKKYGGTGLKLALAKKMLASLGGVIWVESEQGQGSTFNFIIPIEKLQ